MNCCGNCKEGKPSDTPYQDVYICDYMKRTGKGLRKSLVNRLNYCIKWKAFHDVEFIEVDNGI